MTYIRPSTGPTSVYPQTMPLGPKPPETQELEIRPDEDTSSISAQPETTTLADLVAKARAAQAAEPETVLKTEQEPVATAPQAPNQTVRPPQLPPKPVTLRPPTQPQLAMQAQQSQPAPQQKPSSPPGGEKEHQQAVDDKNAANNHPAKVASDWVGYADAGKEGVKFVADDLPDLVRTPPSLIGRIFNRIPTIANGLSRFTNSSLVRGIGNFLSHSAVKPVVKGLGRVAPFAAAAVTGFDIYRTGKDLQDPKASTVKKVLSVAKSVSSVVGSAAGIAAIFLAPTGVGAAVAGGISLVAGLLTFGLDTAVDAMN